MRRIAQHLLALAVALAAAAPLQAANMCSMQMPAAWTAAGGTAGQWTGGTNYVFGGVRNPTSMRSLAGTDTPTYFDADLYGIVCASFPTASGGPDPILGQAAAIAALQSADVGLQTQITAISPWSGASAAEGQEERAEDMYALWLLYVQAAVVIVCLKWIYNVFRTPNHVG